MPTSSLPLSLSLPHNPCILFSLRRINFILWFPGAQRLVEWFNSRVYFLPNFVTLTSANSNTAPSRLNDASSLSSSASDTPGNSWPPAASRNLRRNPHAANQPFVSYESLTSPRCSSPSAGVATSWVRDWDERTWIVFGLVLSFLIESHYWSFFCRLCKVCIVMSVSTFDIPLIFAEVKCHPGYGALSRLQPDIISAWWSQKARRARI